MRRVVGWSLVLGIVGGVVILGWLLRREPVPSSDLWREPWGDC